MENFIDEAKKYMSSDEGKNVESQAQGILDNNTGEGIDESTYKPPAGGSSGTNAFPTSSPSYGSSDRDTSNQYTTQNNNLSDSGAGSGGQGAGRGGIGGIGGSGGRQRRESQYEGYEGAGDSATSGGYGANERGDAFSRENQMGTDAHSGPQPTSHSQFHGRTNSGDDYNDRYKSRSGTSTPGYLGEGDGNEEYDGKKTQGGGGSAGLDPYGDNEADDTSNNPYHERRS